MRKPVTIFVNVVVNNLVIQEDNIGIMATYIVNIV